jgi:hypothetical protein
MESLLTGWGPTAGASGGSSAGAHASSGQEERTNLAVQPLLGLCSAESTAALLRLVWNAIQTGFSDLAEPTAKLLAEWWPAAPRQLAYLLAAGLGASVIVMGGVLPHVVLQNSKTVQLPLTTALACGFVMASALGKGISAGLASGLSAAWSLAAPLLALAGANALGWALVPLHGLAALMPLLAWTLCVQLVCRGISNAAATAKLPAPETVSEATYQVQSFLSLLMQNLAAGSCAHVL